MGQAHLFTLHKPFAFRFHHNIPYAYRDKVCHCEFFNYKNYQKEPFEYPYICSNCGLYNVNMFYQCVGCSEHFIKDFQTNRFCMWEHYKCWGCMQEVLVTADICCDRVRWALDTRRDVFKNPTGVNPKRLTQEEMDAILGDEFSFEIN